MRRQTLLILTVLLAIALGGCASSGVAGDLTPCERAERILDLAAAVLMGFDEGMKTAEEFWAAYSDDEIREKIEEWAKAEGALRWLRLLESGIRAFAESRCTAPPPAGLAAPGGPPLVKIHGAMVPVPSDP